MGKARDEGLVIIGDGANINMRAKLAQQLATVGFSNIEPLGAKQLYSSAKEIESATGFSRLEIVLDFICACMTGDGLESFWV